MLPDPVPGPGQVLIRVRAVSLNYRDLLMSKGLYNPKLKLPIVPISDGAGEVVATGAGVTRFKPGEQVVASFMPEWVDGPSDDEKARSALGGGGVGLLAELAVLPEHGLVPIPSHLTYRGSRHLALRGRDRLERPGRRVAGSSLAIRSSSRGRAESRSSRFSSPGWRAHG